MVIFSPPSLRTSQGRWRAKHTATPACLGVGPSLRSTRRPQLAQASVLSEKHTATSALLRRRSFSVIGVPLKSVPAASAPRHTQHHTLSAVLPRSQFQSAILAISTRPESSSARRLSLLRRRFLGDLGAVLLLARFVKGAVIYRLWCCDPSQSCSCDTRKARVGGFPLRSSLTTWTCKGDITVSTFVA